LWIDFQYPKCESTDSFRPSLKNRTNVDPHLNTNYLQSQEATGFRIAMGTQNKSVKEIIFKKNTSNGTALH